MSEQVHYAILFEDNMVGLHFEKLEIISGINQCMPSLSQQPRNFKVGLKYSAMRINPSPSRQAPNPKASQFSLRISSSLPTSIAPDKMQSFSRSVAPALRAASRRQGYSTSTGGYAATIENLRVNKDTKVIYQGFTGKQGT